MITNDALQNVLFIKYSQAVGTAFTIDIEGIQYLISAKHIFKGIKSKDSVEVFNNNQWKLLHVEPIICNEEIDIIAFKYIRNSSITPKYMTHPSCNGITLSQGVYFVGFPYGLKTDTLRDNNGYPVPFVKKAILSAIEGNVLYFDGHNNSGFSGSPLYFRNLKTNKLQIAAVVSAYLIDRDEKKINGGFNENSGIFIGYSVDCIVDCIKKNIKS